MEFTIDREESSLLAVRIGALLTLFLLLPILAGAKELPATLPAIQQLQQAVGKDWIVTAMPDGYLVTYRPPVIFYSGISENSKLNDRQRMEKGPTTSLQIRIKCVPALSEQVAHDFTRLNAYNELLRTFPSGYFACGDADLWGVNPTWYGNDYYRHPYAQFSCNVPPDMRLTSSVEETYEHALDVLAPFFDEIRGMSPIED